MNKQSGISLSEVLVSLFIAGIIMTTLTQFYLTNKHLYLESRAILEARLDVQWVSDLLGDSIRRAGFTPCLGIEQLQAVDRRESGKPLLALSSGKSQSLQINRMSEAFAEIDSIQNQMQIRVKEPLLFNEHRPVLIADCEHAEVHQIFRVDKLSKITLITLTQPLMFSYAPPVYVGEWLEEKWFIRSNEQGADTLHYKLFQTEEISPLIHSLQVENQMSHEKQLVKMTFGLDENKKHQFLVAVRGS